MEPIKLGSRLHQIASYVPQGARVGDIGTDHAYLPVYLLQNGIAVYAVGVDIHQGPYVSALNTVRSYRLENKIAIRFGNGLEPIEPGEIDTVTIAGMGGNTIMDILTNKPAVLQGVTDLILQPQGAEAKVRLRLLQDGWKLSDECLVADDKRIYGILHFNRQKGLGLDEAYQQCRLLNNELMIGAAEIVEKYFWQFGPLIIKRKEILLEQLIADRIEDIENIISQLTKTERPEVKDQAIALQTEKNIVEGMQKWLFP